MLVKVYDVFPWLMYGQVRQPCLELQRNVPAGGLGVSSLFPSCIKQLLDEVEHERSVLSAEADNTDTRF